MSALDNQPAKITYAKPPLQEVVFGVQFPSIPDFTVGHIGKLWQKYEAEYPGFREQPAFVATIERLPGELPFTNTPTLMPRCIFAAPDDASVIQIQRDAFYYNWRKVTEDYPRYEVVADRFDVEFKKFAQFIESHNLASLAPNQLELTYLNEIPVDVDVLHILKDAAWIPNNHSFLPPPAFISLTANFVMDGGLGTLHSDFRIIAKDDKELVYQWILVARGCTKPRSDLTFDKMRPWYDEARNWIVQGFTDLSTDEAQQVLWERQS
ncbi:hypothetical protein BH11CYA1_BH11CYA1_11590 [soil metagenome]